MTPGVSFIPAFMSVVFRLLEGSDGEVTTEVRRHIYEVLRQAVRHHSQGSGRNRLESLAGLIKQGMEHRARSVRLSAG